MLYTTEIIRLPLRPVPFDDDDYEDGQLFFRRCNYIRGIEAIS